MWIKDIPPTDTPARKAWARVNQKITSKYSVPVNLDNLGIGLIRGISHPALVDDGMHRLARVYDLHGLCKVEFTLKDWGSGSAQLFESYVLLCIRDGVPNLDTFLSMCKAGQFLREDTA